MSSVYTPQNTHFAKVPSADFNPPSTPNARTNIANLFQDVTGYEEIIKKLDDFTHVAEGMRLHGLDPQGQIPMTFIFEEPPGNSCRF